MKITTDASVKGQELITDALLERSLEKFDEGLRSRPTKGGLPATRFEGRELKDGTYLLSTYLGGMYAVITTRYWQWVGLTEQLTGAASIVANHQKTATPVVFQLGKEVSK